MEGVNSGIKVVSRGAKLLASLFVGKKVNGLYDIPGIYFKVWCESGEFPVISKQQCIYGEFLFEDCVKNFIETYYEYGEVKYEEEVGNFRKRCVREIIFEINPEWLVDDKEDYITSGDISDFVQTVAKNRIWGDDVIKGQMTVLTQYMTGGTCAWNEGVVAVVDEGGGEVKEELGDDELEMLEREAWKRCIAPQYIEYVETINLGLLKSILIDNLGAPFRPIGRQKELLIGLKRFNFVAASRRSGKTMFGTYLAARQFYIPNQVIVYIVPTLRGHGRVPRRYLFTMLKWNPNISFNRGEWTITNRKNGSEIIFFSGERENTVRGQAANLLIFDEAAFLSEQLYITAEPLIRTTNGIVYCISTVNPDTPKNRFYYKLVEAEIAKYDKNSNKVGRRITLWENPFINDEEKKSIVEDGKNNLKLFQAEWMAEFQDSDAFDFSKFRVVDYQPVEVMVGGVRKLLIKDEALDTNMNTYHHFIICHDSAKLRDRPGVGVIGVKFKKNAQGELVQQGCDIVASGYMSGFEYMDQVNLIMKLKELLGKDKTSIVIEYNHGGVVVEELFRRYYNEYVIPIQTVGGNTFMRDGSIWRVGKDMLIAKFASAVDRGVLRAFSFMEQLRIEIESFDVNDTQQTRRDGHHFDIMSALFCGVFFADQSGFMEIYKDTIKDVEYERILESFGDPYIRNYLENIANNDDMERYRKFGY